MKKIILLNGFLFLLTYTLFSQSMKTINRDSFSVNYPATWHIDTEDEDYDPDALFSIDSPGDSGSSIMFIIFNVPMDAEEMLEDQIKEMKKTLIKKPVSITDFSQWGKYKGKGKIAKGKLMGVYQGSISYFIYTDDNKSMLVMIQTYDSDPESRKAEMKMIVDSFTFK